MFDSFLDFPHAKEVFNEIEDIQLSFLTHAGPQTASSVERNIESLLQRHQLEGLFSQRKTRFQDPIAMILLSSCAAFTVDAYYKYSVPAGILLNTSNLNAAPFATVFGPALSGVVKKLKSTGDGPSKNCILFSEHSINTAWFCGFIRQTMVDHCPKELWSDALKTSNANVDYPDSIVSLIGIETMHTFLCARNESRIDMEQEDYEDSELFSRLYISFMLSHEYAHIALDHKPRLNEDEDVEVSSFRMRELSDVLDALSQVMRTRVSLSPSRFLYFFGHQEDELSADLLAFLVIYSRLSSDVDCDNNLRLFFRACALSIMWNEIHEVTGRTIKHGHLWYSDPLNHPDFCLLGDLTWRKRYPSAFSRLEYLSKRGGSFMPETHESIMREEFHETLLVTHLWRRIVVTVARAVKERWSEQTPEATNMREHFVWRSPPKSVRDSIGYNDQSVTFDVYRWRDHIRQN